MNRNSAAEIIRLRHLYRKKIMDGKARIERAAAVKMVGPDCAYHLYPGHQGGMMPLSSSQAETEK
jgi:hypothetical protein